MPVALVEKAHDRKQEDERHERRVETVDRPEQEVSAERQRQDDERLREGVIRHELLHESSGEHDDAAREQPRDDLHRQRHLRVADGQQMHCRHHQRPARARVALHALAGVPHQPVPMREIARVLHRDRLVVVEPEVARAIDGQTGRTKRDGECQSDESQREEAGERESRHSGAAGLRWLQARSTSGRSRRAPGMPASPSRSQRRPWQSTSRRAR